MRDLEIRGEGINVNDRIEIDLFMIRFRIERC
jgi:hypothetical protein